LNADNGLSLDTENVRSRDFGGVLVFGDAGLVPPPPNFNSLVCESTVSGAESVDPMFRSPRRESESVRRRVSVRVRDPVECEVSAETEGERRRERVELSWEGGVCIDERSISGD